MGRVLVPAIIENQYDLFEVSQGRRRPEEVRRLEVPDALVDTGAKMLSLPKRFIDSLGLQFLQEKQVNYHRWISKTPHVWAGEIDGHGPGRTSGCCSPAG